MRHCLFYFFIILLFHSCTESRKISDDNLSYQYKRDIQAFHPDFSVYHFDDSISDLYFKIKAQELLYRRNENSNQEARFRLHYVLKPSYVSTLVLDSASATIKEEAGPDSSQFIIGRIPFKIRKSTNVLIQITLTDLNKNLSSRHFYNINKTAQSRQFFLVTSAETEIPIFRNYVDEDERVSIQVNDTNKRILHGRYYNRKFSLPAPPFSAQAPKPFSYKADSLFQLILNDSLKVILALPKEGFYHFQTDTLIKEGLTLFRFNRSFPVVSQPEQLIPPLRYLTSKNEFEEITSQDNKKAAVDKFWLDLAGSPSRARQLLKTFYNRVQDVNIYFSSYVEGWKTDRGLIYIIYGPPASVYKTHDFETWTYGEARGMQSLTFTFVRVNNPFTDNDYNLNRDELYKNSWYSAVDLWRQGRIFTD